jgi:outer membrane protein assembly factor BamB
VRRTLAAGAAIVLAGVLSAAPRFGSAQTPSSSWSTFHGDRARDGVSSVKGPTGPTAVTNFILPAPTSTSLPYISSPVVSASGAAFVGSENGNVYELLPSSPGNPKWTFKTNGPVVSTPTLSADGSRLFVGSNDGNVYAINTADGKQLWVASLGSAVRSSPLLSADGNSVYVASITGTIESLATSNGSVNWKFLAANTAITGSLASTSDGNTLYFVSGDNIYAIPSSNPSGSGNIQVGYLDGAGTSTPSVDPNGNIYVGTVRGYLDCFTATLKACWSQQYQVPNFPPVTSSPAFQGGNAIFGGGNYVYAVSMSSGAIAWRALTGGSVNSSPAVATGNAMIYVGSADGNLYALDTGGNVKFTRKLGGPGDSSPALAPDGTLWIADRSGLVLQLGAIGQPVGIPTGTITPKTPTPVATAVSTGTAVPSATATATASATPSGLPLTISLTGKVNAGQKQTIQITSAANTQVKLRVEYPNGDHQSKSVTTNGSGSATYQYTQAASKITHRNFTATVIARVGSGATQNTVTKTYTIGFGKIDVSVEPRSQSIGKQIDIFIHAKAGTKVAAYILPPHGKLITKTGHTGAKGFASIKFTLPKGLVSGHNVKVQVLAKFRNNPNVATKTTFTVK